MTSTKDNRTQKDERPLGDEDAEQRDIELLPELDLGDLPREYKTPFVALLPQSPTSAVCVWNLPVDRLASFHGKKVGIRLLDCTREPKVFAKVHVMIEERRWLMQDLKADRAYMAELGIQTPDGFQVELISARVALPPQRESRIHNPTFYTPPQPGPSQSDLRVVTGQSRVVGVDTPGFSEIDHNEAATDADATVAANSSQQRYPLLPLGYSSPSPESK